MDKIQIGKRIRAARKAKGMTQAQLAEAVSMHEKHISKIEAGKFHPTYENMCKIFKVLNMELFTSSVCNNTPLEENKVKIEFLKIVNTSSDGELEFYLITLKVIQKILNAFKTKIRKELIAQLQKEA